MAHNIDITNGVASAAFAREDAWHQLGETLPDSFTAEEAMEAAHLGGWNVRKAPLKVDVSDDEEQREIALPRFYGVVRDNPIVQGQIDALGVVGSAYHPIQNEEHAEFLNALVDESGAHFETAGAIDDGRRVFITMKMPDHILVGGVDRVDQYIAAINSHDGTSSFLCMVTPVRIVCENTLNAALGGMSPRFRIRHTRGYKDALGEARKTLDLSFKYLDKFQEEAERMINTELSDREFRKIIDAEWGVSDDAPKAVQTRAENKLDTMFQLFTEAGTQEGMRNTAWAGFNAVTEWADHFSPVRGEDETKRAQNAVFNEFKDNAFKLFATV
jgi:phage/plasmid-like protein (TIGR03299 family)